MLARDIFARINSQADFAPTSTPGWLKYVSDTINDAYNEIWYSREWTFNTKTVELPVYPDLTAAQALELFTGETDATANPLVVVLGQTYGTITVTGGTPTFYSQVDHALLEQLTGASLEIEGRDYTIVDYKIVDNGSTWSIWFYFDLPFFGAHPASTDVDITDWKLKFKQYKLPEDCVDIIDVSWNNTRDVGALRTGQAVALAPRTAHDAALNMQLTSAKPYCYVPYNNTYQGQLIQSFAVTQNTGVGTAFSTGTYYFAWEHVDMVTGASSGITEAITVNITATNVLSITFADNRTLPIGEYRRLLVGVRRTSDDLIQWYYCNYFATNSVVQPWDPDNPFIWRSETATKTLTWGNYISASSLQGASYAGGYQGQGQTHYIGNNDRKKILFYPRLSTIDFDRTTEVGVIKESLATITYRSKCAPLVDQYDSPQLPAEFHQLIIFKALEAVCLKFEKDVQARYYAGKFQEQYRLMVTAYGNNHNIIMRKGNSMGIHGSFPVRPFTINYQG